MKKIYALIFIMFAFAVNAQEQTGGARIVFGNEPVYTDKNGLFVNGEGVPVNGTVTEYLEGNVKSYDITIKDGVMNGEALQYQDGRVSVKYTYKDGAMNSATIFEYYNNGKVKNEAPYDSEGKLDGTAKAYYDNGQTQSEASYMKGQLNGTARKYFKNGGIEMEQTFKSDKLTGSTRVYNADNKLKHELSYIDGKKDGVEKIYREDGSVSLEINHKNDQVVSGSCISKEGEKTALTQPQLSDWTKGLELTCPK